MHHNIVVFLELIVYMNYQKQQTPSGAWSILDCHKQYVFKERDSTYWDKINNNFQKPFKDPPLGRYGQNILMYVHSHEHLIPTNFRKIH